MNSTTNLLPDLKLRLNIDHPGYEESYCFGYDCAAALMDEEENPYAGGTEEHNHWLEGWWAGFYGEEPLFKSSDTANDRKPEMVLTAANDKAFHFDYSVFITNFLKITGAITATAVLGYQILDLVA